MSLRHVVIAGAGLAGLCAARELVRGHVAVTIIDARERAGGRVWTVVDPANRRTHAELGGELIDEAHRTMRGLADEAGLTVVPVLRGGFVQRFKTPSGFHVSRGRMWRQLAATFAPLVDQYRAAGQNVEALRAIARYSVRDWLDEVGADPALHALADSFRGFFLADAEQLSALPLVEQMAKSGSPAQTKVYRVTGGNRRLIEWLVRSVQPRMLTAHHVQGIVDDGDHVRVQVRDRADRLQEVLADAAVLAMPASTLRDVELRVDMPDEQRRAIATLAYGTATKAIVASSDPLLRDHAARAFASDGAAGAFWDSTEGQLDGARQTLTFLAGGSASAALRERIDSGPRELLGPLCWLGLDRTTDDHPWLASATWERDPLARGGYAVFDPSFDPGWRELLSRRAGRIAFAGEHTSRDWQGYMEGAAESGIRAARELLASGF